MEMKYVYIEDVHCLLVFAVRYIEVIPTPEYKSRNEFLQCKFFS